jgi:hypothetical protein
MLRLCNKLKLLPSLAAFSLLLVASGCNQDSIFDYISGETAPTEATIKGAPSKIVSAGTGGDKKLYIANGRVWEYAPAESDSRWRRIAGPEGFAADVASTSDSVYALAMANATGKVWKRPNTAGDWTPLDPDDDYSFIQNIFGAGDILFATGAKKAGNDYDYALLYCKQTDQKFAVLAETGKAFLSGAGKVGGDYYLATRGKGIYKAPDSDISTIALATAATDIPADITGFLQAEQDIILGVSKSGNIVYIDSSGLKVDSTTLGGNYTGALALIDIDNPDPLDGFDKLLLLGYKDPSALYTHGYMELRFKSSDGTRDSSGKRIPGNAQPSSVSEYRQYDSSLRRHPVTALWALPPESGSPPVIFAATTNKGLYSYRNRSDGGWQWNHEE